ncbi:MAG TPA: amidase family protein [Streptosporangiaceae bacterium]|jgi:amidase
MDDELCFMPAVELARLVRGRELAARELVGAFLGRIERVNPAVNAIVTLAPERALREAEAADEAAARGSWRGVLHGLPIAVKDLAETAGMRTTYGSPLFADHVPDADAPHVALLRAAGAIVVGKTNTPEFGMGSQTFNPVFGVTRNPHDLRMTSGGSSGGAAAAVAAGLLPFADGSDLAASVRNPAAMCGVTGLRTTPGAIPGGRPADSDVFDPLAVVGPIARSAEDAALLLEGLSGRDPRLPLARMGVGSGGRLDEVDLAELRIAWSDDLGGLAVAGEVTGVLRRARVALEEAGALVIEDEPDLGGADEVFEVLRAGRLAAGFGGMLGRHRDQMKDTFVWNVEQGLALSGAQVGAAMLGRSRLFGRMKDFLAGGGAGRGYEVLALPTVQVAPFPVEVEWVSEIDGRPQETYLEWMRSCSRITVTTHPSVSVPAGFTEGGLPVGLQLVGAYGGDLRLLAAAKAVSAVLSPGGAVRPGLG